MGVRRSHLTPDSTVGPSLAKDPGPCACLGVGAALGVCNALSPDGLLSSNWRVGYFAQA